MGLDGTAKLTDFGVSVIMTNNTDTVQAAGPGDTCAANPALAPCQRLQCISCHADKAVQCRSYLP